MAAKSTGSPITIFATVVSVVLALTVAYYLFRPEAPPPAGPEVTQAPAPAPEAAATPAPTPTPAATPPPLPTVETARPAATPPSKTPEADPGAITVMGTMLDSTGSVIAGGQVFVVPKTDERLVDIVRKAFGREESHTIVTAGDDGSFRFSLPAEKAFVAGPMIEGEPQAFVQEIAPSKGGTRTEMNFTLPRPYEVRGSVSDERAVTIPGIPLIVRTQATSLLSRESEPKERRVQTTPDGRFSFQVLEPARIELTIDRENLPAPYLYEKPPTVLTREDFGKVYTHRVDLELTSGVNFTGQVVGGANAPAPGEGIANVEVKMAALHDNPERQEFVTGTDEDGFFAFARLFPRDYLVTATLPGFNVAYVHDFRPGDVEHLDIELNSLTVLQGSVAVKEDSLAGAKAVVSLIDRGQGRRTQGSIGSDLMAPFSFDSVAPGPYLLFAEIEKDGRVWYGEKSIMVESGSLGEIGNLELRPLVEVRGTLVGVAANEFESLTFGAARTTKMENHFPVAPARSDWRRLPTGTTSDSGSFTVENLLLNEEYLLTVQERTTNRVIGAAVAVPGKHDSLRVAVNGVGSISGRVLNPRGEACPGVEVRLKTGLGGLEGAASDVQERAVRTNYDGTYHFPSVPSGQARIVLEDDRTTARLISVTSDKDLPIDFKCRTYVDIVFNVKDAEPFQTGEQFLVIPMPGTVVLDSVKELTLEELKASLEPGTYSITRTMTMESRTFDVVPRLHGMIDIDFTSQ